MTICHHPSLEPGFLTWLVHYLGSFCWFFSLLQNMIYLIFSNIFDLKASFIMKVLFHRNVDDEDKKFYRMQHS